jgi:murein DD-endopeptidase MepM/ murein hydrolase activator NlpD
MLSGRAAILVMGFALLLAVACVIAPVAYPPLRHPFVLLSLLNDTMPRRLPVPVSGVMSWQLADTWGAPRGRSRRHQGIDIFARRSTPVVSATRGIVVGKGWNRLGGRVMTIMGPGGYRHYYAHLEGWGREQVGDRVKRGDTIGYVGDSGNAAGTPTHLHYGIYRPAGGAIDPFPLLR